MTVFDKIDNWIRLNNTSRRQLAIKSGVSPSTLQSIMERRKTISLDVLVPIAKTMGIPVETLLDSKGQGKVGPADLGGQSAKDIDEEKKYIQDNLSGADLWGQLAEEAAELAQAALKMQRLALGVNPPRISPEACRSALVEELVDVLLVLELLDGRIDSTSMEYRAIYERKIERWASCLRKLKSPV